MKDIEHEIEKGNLKAEAKEMEDREKGECLVCGEIGEYTEDSFEHEHGVEKWEEWICQNRDCPDFQEVI